MAGNDILSRIQILLDADTARFEQGMQDAQDTSESSFKKIRESANKMGGWIAGAATTAIGGLASMSVAFAEQSKEIEINSYKAQATTTEFQKMAAGAKQVGIESDALADIYKDFNEKLGEMVSVGGGGGVDFFEQVALKTEGSAAGAMKLAKAMAELSGPQAMQLYVDKMEEANLSQDQMSFLMESMGSEATMLLPLLKNGGEGFRLWSEAAERAGIIMDEQAIAKSAEFRVQSELLQMQLQGAKNQLMQAVVPAFTDIANAFFSGTEKGMQFSEVASGVSTVLKFLAKTGLGVVTVFQTLGKTIGAVIASASTIVQDMSWYEFNPIGLTRAVTRNSKQLVSIWSEASTDISDSWLGMAERFDKLDTGNASEEIKSMAGVLREGTKQQAAATKGTQDWIDKQNEAAKTAKSTADTLKNQQAQERWAIEYENADRLAKMEMDLFKDVERVKKAGFRPDSEKSIITMLDQRASLEKAIWIDQYEFDLNEFQLTEEAKLQWKQRINEMSIELDRELTREQKDTKRQATLDQYNYELEMMKNRKQQELLELKSYHMTELEFIRQNEILKRQEIEKTKGISDEERQARLGRLEFDTQSQVGNVKDSALEDLRGLHNDLNGTSGYQALQDQFDGRMQILDENLAAENITWDQYLTQRKDIIEAANVAEASMNLGHMESMTGSMLDILATTSGKQSGIYKAMFAVNKAFSIAQSMIAIKTGIAQAAGLAFPLNLAAMAQVATSTASLISDIQSVKLAIDGQAHDGIDKVPADGTWLLKKNERVTTERTSAKLDKTLDEVRSGYATPGLVMNIEVLNQAKGATVETQQIDENRVRIIVRDEVDRYVPSQMANSNSKIMKAMQRHTTTKVNRA